MLPAEKSSEKLRPAERICVILASVIAALLVFEFLLRNHIDVSIPAEITLVLLMVLFYYAAALLRYHRTGNLRFLRAIQILLFVLYLSFLVDVTLFAFSVGRMHNYSGPRDEYLYWYCNFTPFSTVILYIRGYGNGYVSFWAMILNLLGNFVLFSPLSLFLPLFFPPERRFYFFLPTLLLFPAAVEALQYLFMVGRCDVDDLILNFVGAAMIFFILKIPPLRRLVRRLTVSEF